MAITANLFPALSAWTLTNSTVTNEVLCLSGINSKAVCTLALAPFNDAISGNITLTYDTTTLNKETTDMLGILKIVSPDKTVTYNIPLAYDALFAAGVNKGLQNIIIPLDIFYKAVTEVTFTVVSLSLMPRYVYTAVMLNTVNEVDGAIITGLKENEEIKEILDAYASVEDLRATNSSITTLAANTATVVQLNAVNAVIEDLNADIGTINELFAGNITANNMKVNTITAASGIIADAAITKAKIASLSVDTSKIVDASITTAKIEALAVTNAKIGNLAVDAAKIANLAVTNAKIQDAAITTAKIGDAEITGAKIAQTTIGTANIVLGAITKALLGTAAVGTAQIEDASISNAKIIDLNAAKINAGTIDTSKVTIQGTGGKLKAFNNRIQVFDAQTVPVERVAIGDVNNDGTAYGFRVRGADGVTVLLDEDGVHNEGITDGAITNEKIADNAGVDGDKLLTDSISGTKLIADSITARELVAHSITANEVMANSITGNELAANTITAANIAANTITVAKLAPGIGQSLDISSNTAITSRVTTEVFDGRMSNVDQQLSAINLTFARNGYKNLISNSAGILYSVLAGIYDISAWAQKDLQGCAVAPCDTTSGSSFNLKSSVSNGTQICQTIETVVGKSYTLCVKAKANNSVAHLKAWIEDPILSGFNHYLNTSPITIITGTPSFDRVHAECINGIFMVGDNTGLSAIRIGNVITANGLWTISFELRGSQSGAQAITIDICNLGATVVRTTANNDWSNISVTVNVTNYSAVNNYINFSKIGWAYFLIRNIYVEQTTAIQLLDINNVVYNDMWKSFSATFVATLTSTALCFKNVSNNLQSIALSDTMIVEGTNAPPWTQSTDEMFTSNIKISDTGGIAVGSSETPMHSLITTDSFSISRGTEVRILVTPEATRLQKTVIEDNLDIGVLRILKRDNGADFIIL